MKRIVSRKLLLPGAAAATFVLIGAAHAEPVALGPGDMAGVRAGAVLPPGPSLFVVKAAAIKKLKDLRIEAKLRSDAVVEGNLAEAEAGATATGSDTFTETLTLSDVVDGVGSRSFSESVAASSHVSPAPKK